MTKAKILIVMKTTVNIMEMIQIIQGTVPKVTALIEAEAEVEALVVAEVKDLTEAEVVGAKVVALTEAEGVVLTEAEVVALTEAEVVDLTGAEVMGVKERKPLVKFRVRFNLLETAYVTSQ